MCTNRVRTSLIYDVINRLSSLHSFTCDSWLKRCDSKIKPNKWRENKPPFVLFFIILIMHLLSIFSAWRLSPRVLQRHHCWKMWAYHVLLHEAVVLSDAWWVFFFFSSSSPAGYPFAVVYRRFLFHQSSTVIHLFHAVTGLALAAFNFGEMTTTFVRLYWRCWRWRSFLKRQLLGSRSVNTENAV